MREVSIGKNEAGQRLDKMLTKYLNQAPKSFLYKMLRKKNITLNGKKANGNEKLMVGDTIKLFLSDDTLEKFTNHSQSFHLPDKEGDFHSNNLEKRRDGKEITSCLDIIYEDENVLIINKPVGILSQKADKNEESVVDQVITHCLEAGKMGREELQFFRPSVCNRLDRNTSGILVAGVSLLGLQQMAKLFHDRTIHKYYYCMVAGQLKKGKRISGYLTKDHEKNKVTITKEPITKESQRIETEYEPLSMGKHVTYVRVYLITGRSHQIRAHLSSIGHPIIGDVKYGEVGTNRYYKKQYGVKNQMLHAGEIQFPEMEGEFKGLSGKIITAPLPPVFERVMRGEGIFE